MKPAKDPLLERPLSSGEEVPATKTALKFGAGLDESQALWASLGGLGPVPTDVVHNARLARNDDLKAYAVQHAERAVAQQRHDLRMRLLERALPAMLAHAHDVASLSGRLVVKDREVGPEEWAVDSAVDGVGAMLDHLAAEAKASAKGGAA